MWRLLKIRHPRLRSGNILDVDGYGVWERVLKIRQLSWTSYVYRPYICLSYVYVKNAGGGEGLSRGGGLSLKHFLNITFWKR